MTVYEIVCIKSIYSHFDCLNYQKKIKKKMNKKAEGFLSSLVSILFLYSVLIFACFGSRSKWCKFLNSNTTSCIDGYLYKTWDYVPSLNPPLDDSAYIGRRKSTSTINQFTAENDEMNWYLSFLTWLNVFVAGFDTVA